MGYFAKQQPTWAAGQFTPSSTGKLLDLNWSAL
jgi:hypothetical protein